MGESRAGEVGGSIEPCESFVLFFLRKPRLGMWKSGCDLFAAGSLRGLTGRSSAAMMGNGFRTSYTSKGRRARIPRERCRATPERWMKRAVAKYGLMDSRALTIPADLPQRQRRCQLMDREWRRRRAGSRRGARASGLWTVMLGPLRIVVSTDGLNRRQFATNCNALRLLNR